MGNKCPCSTQQPDPSIQSSILSEKSDRRSNTYKRHTPSLLLGTQTSSHLLSDQTTSMQPGFCALCKQKIIQEAKSLECQHQYHQNCLLQLITLQSENGAQLFICSQCPQQFGANAILQIELTIPENWYCCKTCNENCIRIQAGEDIQFCQKCTRSEGLTRLKR